jgi:hypothetical protein
VELSLVAGAPQSFIQNLSQPFYSRRPVVPLAESYAMSPQTHQATLAPGAARIAGRITDPTGAAMPGAQVQAYDESGQLLAETAAGGNGSYELSVPAAGAVRLEIASPGFKKVVVHGLNASLGQTARQDVELQVASVAETIEVTADASRLNTSTASVASGSRTLGTGAALGRARGIGGATGSGSGGGFAGATLDPADARVRAEAAALGHGLGDLFEYKLKEPVSIRKNQSALVPIVHATIESEKVSIWNDSSGAVAPTRALWLTNTTGLTLDGGSFNVLEDETFAGEGILDPIRPGEKRLISYAVDLALNASSRQSAQRQRVTRVRVSKGVMVHESEVQEKKTYTFRNSDAVPRTVIVEQKMRPGYELRGDTRPVETTAGWMRFRQRVEPGQTATLLVEEARPLHSSYEIAKVGTDQVSLFVRQQSIDKSVEEALRRVLAQKDVIAKLEEQKEALDKESQNIFEDQQRLRENLKSLKGSAEEKALVERYTRRLAEQETRLEAVKVENQKLDAAISEEEAALETLIQELFFDVKL